MHGVGLIHQDFIVHLDLKPNNLVFSFDDRHLFIIDFGLAMRLSNDDETVKGFRGTKPWVVPEVVEEGGYEKIFNPFAADLWATGHIIEYFSSFIESSESSSVMELASQLMHTDPTEQLSLCKQIDPSTQWQWQCQSGLT